MSALTKIGLLGILAVLASQPLSSAPSQALVANISGIQVWRTGTKGNYTFVIHNSNQYKAKVRYELDGEQETTELDPGDHDDVSSNEDEPEFTLLSVGRYSDR